MTSENGNNGMVMPVAPFYSSGGSNGGGFGFGGDGGWLFLILLIALCGGWGGFGGGLNGGGAAEMYPWMHQSDLTSSGFRDQMINDNITSIRDGVYGINNQLCTGFAGVTAAVTNAQNAIAQQMYSNTIADMERSFNVQSALQNCCCENRAGLADVKYTVATESCATRTADATNTRDIIDSQTRGTQAILDKLCSLELDGYKRENDNLRSQLNMATLRESQTAQNALIQQGFSDEVDALYTRLSNCPVPSTPVYGRTPIFTCPNNNGCGCGM